MDTAPVDGGDGDTVLVGIDAVVIRTDGKLAAIDGQMQLRIQAFIIRCQIQLAGAEDIHGHIGINGAVLLPQLLFALFILEDLGHVGAGDGVVSLQDQIGAGFVRIHLSICGLRRPIAVAFISVPEKNSRRNGTCDVRIGEDQFHHSVFILIGRFSQIYPDLTGGEFTADAVSARSRDVHNGVSIGFLRTVLFPRLALSIGIAAFIGILIFIVDDVMGGIDSVRLPCSVYGNALIGQLHFRNGVKAGFVQYFPGNRNLQGFRLRFRLNRELFLFRLHRELFLYGFLSCASHEEAACQSKGQYSFHHSAFFPFNRLSIHLKVETVLKKTVNFSLRTIKTPPRMRGRLQLWITRDGCGAVREPCP